MKNYVGIYGKGYKNNKGTLQLKLENHEGFLIREKNKNNKYNVGVVMKDSYQNDNQLISLEENLSLKKWRELYLELNTKEGQLKLEKAIQSLEPYFNMGMFPWESAFLYPKSDGSFELEFPIPVPPGEMDSEFEFL
jgi:hypothetical protein